MVERSGFHEDFRQESVAPGSDRGFGLVLAAFFALIGAFKAKTGCTVLVNTSFNVRGEPIVCTLEDAFHCFMGTEIEALVVGNCLLRKESQNPARKLDYKNAFELD